MFIVALSLVTKTGSKVNFHITITVKHPNNLLSEKNKIQTIVKFLYGILWILWFVGLSI